MLVVHVVVVLVGILLFGDQIYSSMNRATMGPEQVQLLDGSPYPAKVDIRFVGISISRYHHRSLV